MWRGKVPSLKHIKSGVVRHSLYEIPRTILSPDLKDVGLSVIHKIALDIYFSDPLKMVFVARKGMFLEREMMSLKESVGAQLILKKFEKSVGAQLILKKFEKSVGAQIDLKEI